MGIEPTSPAWEAGVITIIRRPPGSPIITQPVPWFQPPIRLAQGRPIRLARSGQAPRVRCRSSARIESTSEPISRRPIDAGAGQNRGGDRRREWHRPRDGSAIRRRRCRPRSGGRHERGRRPRSRTGERRQLSQSRRERRGAGCRTDRRDGVQRRAHRSVLLQRRYRRRPGTRQHR